MSEEPKSYYWRLGYKERYERRSVLPFPPSPAVSGPHGRAEYFDGWEAADEALAYEADRHLDRIPTGYEP